MVTSHGMHQKSHTPSRIPIVAAISASFVFLLLGLGSCRVVVREPRWFGLSSASVDKGPNWMAIVMLTIVGAAAAYLVARIALMRNGHGEGGTTASEHVAEPLRQNASNLVPVPKSERPPYLQVLTGFGAVCGAAYRLCHYWNWHTELAPWFLGLAVLTGCIVAPLHLAWVWRHAPNGKRNVLIALSLLVTLIVLFVVVLW